MPGVLDSSMFTNRTVEASSPASRLVEEWAETTPAERARPSFKAAEIVELGEQGRLLSGLVSNHGLRKCVAHAFGGRILVAGTVVERIVSTASGRVHNWVLTEALILAAQCVIRRYGDDITPLQDEQRRLMRWYVAVTDIEDYEQAEQRLRNENVTLREEIDKASMQRSDECLWRRRCHAIIASTAGGRAFEARSESASEVETNSGTSSN
jgi:hypothetical protein